MAISKTGDPTGSYYLYAFLMANGADEFPDYPKLGVWPDGYYMSVRQFGGGGTSFDGAAAVGFDRQKMLVGDPHAAAIYFDLSLTIVPPGIDGMLPSDHDGLEPPPAGAPCVFAWFTDDNFGDPGDGLVLYNFHADFNTPANSTFLERPEATYLSPLALAPYDARQPSGRADIEQPPPSTAADNLDSLANSLMFRLQYMNRNGTESLVGNITVNASGVNPSTPANYQAAVRYFQLGKSSPTAPYTVAEQATFSPDAGNGATGLNRWMASAAMDVQGNLAIGYTISGLSPATFASLGYAARAFNDPPGGLFQGEGTLFAGTGVQLATGNRWGDYSSLMIDPVDDCTFWYTSQYYTTNAQFAWHSRIGTFKFPTCTAPAQGTLSGTITDCDGGATFDASMVMVAGGPSAGFSATSNADGTYSTQLAPGDYTVTVSSAPHGCTLAGPFNVTIIDGETTTLDACLTGTPNTAYMSTAVSGGNGNGVIDSNECNDLSVTLMVSGCATARHLSGNALDHDSGSDNNPAKFTLSGCSGRPDRDQHGSILGEHGSGVRVRHPDQLYAERDLRWRLERSYVLLLANVREPAGDNYGQPRTRRLATDAARRPPAPRQRLRHSQGISRPLGRRSALL